MFYLSFSIVTLHVETSMLLMDVCRVTQAQTSPTRFWVFLRNVLVMHRYGNYGPMLKSDISLVHILNSVKATAHRTRRFRLSDYPNYYFSAGDAL